MRKRGRHTSSTELEEIEINLTPLIDVVFVVLIMFIIVAPLLELEKIQLATGPTHAKKQTVSVQEASKVTLHIRADDSILLNGRALMLEQLIPYLKEVHSQFPKAIPQLYNDKRSTFGRYQEVKNAVEEAGFEELEILLKPQ